MLCATTPSRRLFFCFFVFYLLKNKKTTHTNNKTLSILVAGAGESSHLVLAPKVLRDRALLNKGDGGERKCTFDRTGAAPLRRARTLGFCHSLLCLSYADRAGMY